MKKLTVFVLLTVWMFSSCVQRSPENLPKLKQLFNDQISVFEKHKEKAETFMQEGVESLSELQSTINDARKVDKEFNEVYGKWEKVNKRVETLTKEYNELKTRANNLFDALDRQIEGLNNEEQKKQLKVALKKSKEEYNKTLANTETAINKLSSIHAIALDNIKALEAAVAIGQIANINTGLKSIETQVGEIMTELNTTIEESRKVYDNRIQTL